MTNKPYQVGSQTTTETRVHTVDFGDSDTTSDLADGKLNNGELFTGTPTVDVYSKTPSSASDPTLGSKAFNTEVLFANGRAIVIGEAIQFTVTGGTSGATYVMKLSGGTDSSPSQTLESYPEIVIQDPPT